MITPIPQPDRRNPVPEGLELFELDKITIELDPGEILDLQRGASVRDIFAARRATASVDTTQSVEADESVRAEVESLFRNASI